MTRIMLSIEGMGSLDEEWVHRDERRQWFRWRRKQKRKRAGLRRAVTSVASQAVAYLRLREKGPTIRYWCVDWSPDWIRFGQLGDKMNPWDIDDALDDHEDAMRERARKAQYRQAGRAPAGGWTR